MSLTMHGDVSPRSARGTASVSNRFLFMLSLWMSLATAIVCAVMPAGLPLTRTIGSAFDPSTTIVALRARPPALLDDIVARDGAGDDGGAGGTGCAAIPALWPSLVGAGLIVASVLPSPLRLLDLIPRAIESARHARSPPTG